MASLDNGLGRGGETKLEVNSSGKGNPAKRINSPLIKSRKDSCRRCFKDSVLG